MWANGGPHNPAMKTIILLALWAFHAGAWATSGGVDESGCHASQKIGWHCHPQRAKGGGLPGGESHAQREKRLKRECKNSPNAGMCSGYGKI